MKSVPHALWSGSCFIHAQEALCTPSSAQEFVQVAFLLLTGFCWKLDFLLFSLLFSKCSTALLFTASFPFSYCCSSTKSNICVQKAVKCMFWPWDFYWTSLRGKAHPCSSESHSAQHTPQRVVGALLSAVLSSWGQGRPGPQLQNGRVPACLLRQTRLQPVQLHTEMELGGSQFWQITNFLSCRLVRAQNQV